MIKHLLTIGYCLLAIAYCNASEFRDNYFMTGSLTQVTTSDIPGTKWMKNPKSLKISSQYPIFEQPDPWVPLRGEMADLHNCQPALGDMDNDGDIDLLVTRKSPMLVAVFENIGIKYQPTFKRRADRDFSIDRSYYGNCALGDIDKDGKIDLLVDCIVYINGTKTFNIYGYKGRGDFTFERHEGFDIKNLPKNIYNPDWVYEFAPCLGDLNQDNYPDLIVSFLEQGTVTQPGGCALRFLAYENKNGSFTAKPEWNPPYIPNTSRGSSWNLSLSLVDLCETKNPMLCFTHDESGGIECYSNYGTSSPIWPKGPWYHGFKFWANQEGYNAPGDTIDETVCFGDLDGDSDLDMLHGSADPFLFSYENIGNKKNPSFRLHTYQPLDGAHVMGGITFADLDKDGDYEEIHSEGAGSCQQPLVFFSRNTGTQEVPFWSRMGAIDLSQYGFVEVLPTVGDLDGDDKPDLMVDEGGSHTCGFKNTGIISFSYCQTFTLTYQFLLAEGPEFKFNDITDCCSFILDLDNDRDYDVVFVGQNAFMLLENIGGTLSPSFKRNKDWEANTTWQVHDPEEDDPMYELVSAFDLNGDNQEELIFHGYYFSVYKRLGTLSGVFFVRAPEFETEIFKVTSYVYNISGVDLDNDGDYDLVTAYKCSGPIVAGINKAPHHPLGTYTSSIFDAGSSVIFESIFWKERKPFSTELSMYVRSGNSTSTLSSWKKVSNGESLNLNARFIQYQAILSTS
ncbi:MAG: VCBS repeat-containing protein, partial [bacterium]